MRETVLALRVDSGDIMLCTKRKASGGECVSVSRMLYYGYSHLVFPRHCLLISTHLVNILHE